MKEMRTVTVRLIARDVNGLRDLAAISANYANDMLTAKYIDAKNYLRARSFLTPEEQKQLTADEKKKISRDTRSKLTPYRDYASSLSGNVRDAVTKEVEAIWGKYGKAALAGHRSLPIFASERSLSVRDRGVKVLRDDDWYAVSLQLLPKGNDWHTFAVYKFTEKKKMYVTDLLESMADGKIPLRKAMIVFNRKWQRDVSVRLTYEKEFEPNLAELAARIGPVGENGEIYLRADGPAYNFEERRRLASMTALVQMMANKKANIAGIWQRVRLSKKRKAMARLATFEKWSDGPCHQLSSAIVKFCLARKIKELEWRISEADTVKTVGPGGNEQSVAVPWAKIKFQVTYKGQETGLSLTKAVESEVELPVEAAQQINRQHRRALREVRKFADVVAKR